MDEKNMPAPQRAGTDIEVDGLDALVTAASRLKQLSPERFRVVLNLCRAYVAAFDHPEEDEEIFASRIAELRCGARRAQA